MKRKLIVPIIVLLQCFTIAAQDLIVTTAGDSLNCKINQVRGIYIDFAFRFHDGVRNEQIPKSEVASYEYNFYSVSLIQPEELATSHQPDDPKPDFKKWRFSLNTGLGYRTDPIPEWLDPLQKEYVKNLKNGANLSIDANHFDTKIVGFGVKYDLFWSSNSIPEYDTETKISIHFIGPSLAIRVFDRSKRNCLFMSYSLGYTAYVEKYRQYGVSLTAKGRTIGFAASFGYDFGLSKNWSIGAQLSLIAGMLKEFEISDNSGNLSYIMKLDPEQYEGLGRLCASVGVRCSL